MSNRWALSRASLRSRRRLLTRGTSLGLFSARSRNRVIRRGDVVGDEEPAGQRRRAARASVPHGVQEPAELRVPSSVRLRQLPAAAA